MINESVVNYVDDCKCGGRPVLIRNNVFLSVKFNSLALKCSKCGISSCDHKGNTDEESFRCAHLDWQKLQEGR